VTLTWTARRAAAWATFAVVSAVLGSRPASASPEVSAPPVRRYTIRAEVVRLPERPGGDLTLRHEAVEDFTDIAGEVVGMDSMTMPFPVARGAWPNGLEVGDKVVALLVVNWEEGFQVLERITKLPRDTQLHFGRAHHTAKASSTPTNTNQEN